MGYEIAGGSIHLGVWGAMTGETNSEYGDTGGFSHFGVCGELVGASISEYGGWVQIFWYLGGALPFRRMCNT
jgi:hypothetical protein